MSETLALRAFVPARDFELSRRFYAALGFRETHHAADVAGFKLGTASFILQDFYKPELADNFMLQLMVRDVDAWWAAHIDAEKLVATFGVQAPTPPALQQWGMRVGFVWDPSGVLWHVAESLF